MKKSQYTNSSLTKGLMVLKTVAEASDPVGISETARTVGLDYSTAYRLITTLAELDYIEKDLQTGRYRAGPAILPLGMSFQRSSDLIEIALPEMRTLVQEVSETVNLSMLDGEAMMLLATCPGPHLLATRTRIGHRFPIHCSASGHVALAALPYDERDKLVGRLSLTAEAPNTITTREGLLAAVQKVAERGFAVNHEEHVIGLVAVSAPLEGPAGRAIATLDIAVPAVRVENNTYLDELSQYLIARSQRISARISSE